MAEAIPDGMRIQRARIVSAFTQASFEPLVGQTRFSEFNAGQSDHWAGMYTFVPMRSRQTVRLMAWIRRLKHTGNFYAYDPSHKVPANGVVAGLEYDGHTGDLVDLSGGAVSATVLAVGDYIQIGTQYFQLLEDFVTDGAGEGTVQVWPTPRSGLSAGASVVTDNPVMEARITSPTPQGIETGRISQISIAWEQV